MKKRLGKILLFGIMALFAAAMALNAFPVAAIHIGTFELDRDAIDDGGVDGDDWDTLYNALPGTGGNALAYTFVADSYGVPNADDIFNTGGSKDINDMSQWQWAIGNIPDKDDIVNAWAAAYIDHHEGHEHPVIYFGLDRFANNGDAQLGFWFLKEPLSKDGDGTFGPGTPVHSIGDLLVLVHFTGGGGEFTFNVYRWVGPPDTDNLELVASGVDPVTNPTLFESTGAGGTVNGEDANGVDIPTLTVWPYSSKFAADNEPPAAGTQYYPSGSFFEGGIDLHILGLENVCFQTFLAETRSSQSLDAQLKDVVLGEFDLCAIDIEKTGDTLSKVGDTVTYTFTITNPGAIPLYLKSVTDTLLGNITANAQAAAGYVNPLPGSGSYSFSVDYVVPFGAPDPLPNTVTVVYNPASDLTGTDVSDSDIHSVNLFTAGVTIAKTGDTLSKVGDQVTYNVVVTNTSSSDAPNLILDSFTDSKVAGLQAAFVTAGGGVLTNGEVVNFSYTYTVVAGDPDPLLNTATVHYHPDGFPNDVTASDGHSVNLFQPSITINKTGDTLSKVGDAVNYTITVTNTSSADTPNLVGNIVDAKLGINQAVNMAPGAVVTLTPTYTVVAGDPDPLLNTATVTVSPVGFPNVLTASDGHSVNLFQPGVSITKTGPTDGKCGDQITYHITITNTSSLDSPNLILVSINDTLLGDLSAAATSAGLDVLTSNPSESGSFDVLYTIPAGFSGVLNNTVTVHYNPVGFTNDITASDNHSINVTCGEGCTPGFWQGGLGSTLWNTVNDPDWTAHGGVGTNPFIHTTLFNSFFAPQSSLNGLTMFDIVGTGGGNAWPRKTARMVVAAYLNASFGIEFPYTTTQISNMWANAVAANTTAAYQSVFDNLSAANNLGCPIQ